jgi:hypothetical protein
MPEHEIRLRGGWDWLVREDDVEVARRISLPILWPPTPLAPFRLVRRFGRPTIDPDVESVRLELRSVPGLVAARLNEVELARPEGRAVDWLVPLPGPLPARNELVLEVDLGPAARPVEGEPWGLIALRIAHREDLRR